jgi:hypothetical protein
MENIENVKEIINSYHIQTEGRCGLPIPDIQKKSSLSLEETKIILRQLYDEKYIKVREGLNGKLIFRK